MAGAGDGDSSGLRGSERHRFDSRAMSDALIALRVFVTEVYWAVVLSCMNFTR